MAFFSNSSDGDVLQRQCDVCQLGELDCPVLAIQMLHNYNQLDKNETRLREVMNLLVNEKGICKVHLLLVGEKCEVSGCTNQVWGEGWVEVRDQFTGEPTGLIQRRRLCEAHKHLFKGSK